MTSYIDCKDCYYSDWETIAPQTISRACKHPERKYKFCSNERIHDGSCGPKAMHYLPQKHDPPVGTWQVICENCTKIMMVLTSQIKTDAYDDLTIGEFRKQFPCLNEDCPAREIYGSDK